MRFTVFIIFCFVLFGCIQHNAILNQVAKKTVDKNWLDSVIKNHNDSTYNKPYKRTDFVTAYFYINKKDSSTCQVMKDSASTVRQIIIAKKGIRNFFAQYYANGQLQAELPLDELGQYHGLGSYFYEDGTVESSGRYVHGFKNGQWKNYDNKGQIISTIEYDINGQPIQPTK